jgi:hypothetical protein
MAILRKPPHAGISGIHREAVAPAISAIFVETYSKYGAATVAGQKVSNGRSPGRYRAACLVV